MAKSSQDNTYRGGIYRTRGEANAMVTKATATQTVFGGMNIGAGGNLTLVTGSKFKRALRTATGSETLTAAQAGQTIITANIGSIFTLPAATSVGKGLSYKVVVSTGAAAATGGTFGVKIRPNAVDKIIGGSLTGATDGEVVQLTGTGTIIAGDRIEVTSDGSAGWYITDIEGTAWLRAAAT